MCSSRRGPLLLSLLASGSLLSLAAQAGSTAEPLFGFSPRSAERQHTLEQRVRESISTDRMAAHLRVLTAEPHLAGSPRTRQIVEYLHDELVAYGLETEIVEYVGFLPAPISVRLELLEPSRRPLPHVEQSIEEDPFTRDVGRHPGWSGFSPSGVATGQVVYGHFGSEEDFRYLERRGVEVRGKIVLLRNFGTGSGRKIHNAERFGAAGVILYTDPAEDGFPYGEVYPKGNWRPSESIMRRAVEFLPYSGDPLSPGWASTPGARRLSVEEVALPTIPVAPVSYGTAQHLLSLLGGPLAPHAWQGSLPVPYRLGPGPARLRVETEMDNRDRPILNVIARIAGATQPDQWIIVGNHHDAWIFGAGDPSSGTAAQLELARVIGQLVRDGLRPQRTLIFAFWDAEEMGYGGSTEWVEDHYTELLDKAVACINMDSAVFNPDRPLSVSAHPLLHDLFRDVTRAVPDPRSDASTWQVWLDLQNRYRFTPGVDGWGEFFDPEPELTRPYVFEVPFDDAAPFFNLLALPASDMYYGADYGMYHSIYENLHWMLSVVDPTLAYHEVMVQIQGFAALRIANADLLPFDFAEEARWWQKAYSDLAETAAQRDQIVPQIETAQGLIDRWLAEAEALRRETESSLQAETVFSASVEDLRELNRFLYRIPRTLHRTEGHRARAGDRNLFAGASHDFEGVSGSTLPGLRFALDRGDLPAVDAEAALYVEALTARLTALQTARRKLTALSTLP